MASKKNTGSTSPLASEPAPDPAAPHDTAALPTGVDVEGSIEPPPGSRQPGPVPDKPR